MSERLATLDRSNDAHASRRITIGSAAIGALATGSEFLISLESPSCVHFCALACYIDDRGIGASR